MRRAGTCYGPLQSTRQAPRLPGCCMLLYINRTSNGPSSYLGGRRAVAPVWDTETAHLAPPPAVSNFVPRWFVEPASYSCYWPVLGRLLPALLYIRVAIGVKSPRIRHSIIYGPTGVTLTRMDNVQ